MSEENELPIYVAKHFDDRELRLIKNCQNYTIGDPAGLPGHNLMIIIAKLVYALEEEIEYWGDANK